MDSACICDHDRGQHVAPYAKHWPKHCAVIGCTCPEFERTRPASASTPTGAVAGPHRRLIGYRTADGIYHPDDVEVVYEVGDDAATPPAVAGPPDLAHAIQIVREIPEGRGLLPVELDALYATATAAEQLQVTQEEVERLRVTLTAARWWIVEHGLPLTKGQAVLQRGVSWVNVDAALTLGAAQEEDRSG